MSWRSPSAPDQKRRGLEHSNRDGQRAGSERVSTSPSRRWRRHASPIPGQNHCLEFCHPGVGGDSLPFALRRPDVDLDQASEPEGFGKIEFAFNLVFWLVLIVRDCFETIITREIARHPSLTRKPGQSRPRGQADARRWASWRCSRRRAHSSFREPVGPWVLVLYGLLLLTTALGTRFRLPGHEAMGVVAVSLVREDDRSIARGSGTG